MGNSYISQKKLLSKESKSSNSSFHLLELDIRLQHKDSYKVNMVHYKLMMHDKTGFVERTRTWVDWPWITLRTGIGKTEGLLVPWYLYVDIKTKGKTFLKEKKGLEHFAKSTSVGGYTLVGAKYNIMMHCSCSWIRHLWNKFPFYTTLEMDISSFCYMMNDGSEYWDTVSSFEILEGAS